MTDSDARIAALETRLANLEAERAVRETFTRYMALCDVPATVLDGESLGALFTENAVWEGIGTHYAQTFGRSVGRAQIVALLSRYLPPTPHFTTNVHFVTSETIHVNGKQATGRWIMLQASGYVDSRAELIGARLVVDFTPAENSHDWLISHFRTERMFDAPWTVTPRAALPSTDQELSA
ncbi:nuclear transport factor 2 family protein [Paraburkholderia sp. Ac-20340]|uniref:nuclear transport factor 2 family protein n=1 Tax=Paraburkholderia sp. Ac-20340 TaxID=2703888 RepID=UPI0019824305|nr:nuclear transport factor 2 family protein [Paraburkholderia sp. Ac-20340]MBN3851930.1 nuclear transport factor 2 family protein [Paraburkholderia sp. Ac-20340]